MANDHSCDGSPPLTSACFSNEAMECLTCSVCLELLYKPVVTACGHIFCFWCGHHGMNPFKASSCPLCRRPYSYFPRVCKLLHLMLSKALPDEYLRRGLEAQCYEEKIKMFSPELRPSDLRIPPKLKNGDASTTSNEDTMVGDTKDRSPLESSESDSMVRQGETKTREGTLTVDDLSCGLCNLLIYRPVVLNCGDVFCQPCLKKHASKVLHCPSCGAPHPAGSVLVCLELHKFLQSAFPSEYANREQQHPAENDHSANCDAAADSTMDKYPHFGVGCDGCGMFPILGDRYHCEDCEEKAGFDLCGSCYKSTGSCVGRFNQKHQPTHHMRQVEPTFTSIHFADYSVEPA